MSGFDKDWLSLREPADRSARAPALVEMLRRHVEASSDRTILDIGCGTGSTWRSLSGRMPDNTRWTLLDHDRVLLEEAKRRIGAADVTFRQFDLNNISRLSLETVCVVTASALFDLVSDAFCSGFADRAAAAGCGLYAALNYDGKISWSYPHPLDADMVRTFNRHQQGDKGFGRALGPQAVECLERVFRARGYLVHMVSSPWRITEDAADLHEAFLSGFRQPLTEMAEWSEMEIESWLAYRMEAIRFPASLCDVGHTDLIAFPA